MASLNLQSAAPGGSAEVLAAAAVAGDSFPLPGDITVRIRNANGAAARTVTVVAQKKCDQGFLHDQTINVPANSTVVATIPGGTDQYRDAGGRVQLTYSTNADLTLGATAA